jgi:hypothetical protein
MAGRGGAVDRCPLGLNKTVAKQGHCTFPNESPNSCQGLDHESKTESDKEGPGSERGNDHGR